MGTKDNPGEHDCYANARPDEPMFILLGRDVTAPWITRIWEAVRRGDSVSANESLAKAMAERLNAKGYQEMDSKAHEALQCADSMESWRT